MIAHVPWVFRLAIGLWLFGFWLVVGIELWVLAAGVVTSPFVLTALLVGKRHRRGLAVATARTPLPGWYPDPNGEWRLRWWDGSHWTAHTG